MSTYTAILVLSQHYNYKKSKGHMDKIKGEGCGGEGRCVQLGWGGGWGEKAYKCN